MSNRKLFRAGVWGIVGGVLLSAGLCAWRICQANRARERARAAQYAQWGIDAPGTAEFVPLPPALPHDPARAQLGGAIFASARVFKSPTRCCGACHYLNAGGVDGRRHGKTLTRPAVNAVFSEVFLSDASVTGLPALVSCMMTNAAFGNLGSLQAAAERLAADRRFAARFADVYLAPPSVSNVVDALVQFERTLVTTNGRFDRFVAGETNVFSQVQAAGFAAFRRLGCARCHGGPALGGGVADGRKVPALRGLGARKVYLSEGVRTDLDAVLTFMPSPEMTPAERAALLAFLKIL